MKTYKVNEIFYSLQGEGVRAGEASIFVRFSGCNQNCRLKSKGFDCDTKFESYTEMKVSDILYQVRETSKECEWIVFTGGEPGLQLDSNLVKFLHRQGYKLAIETNGSLDISGLDLDWVTVSPKVQEHKVQQLYANEVKYVIGVESSLPRPHCKAQHLLLSPAHDGKKFRPGALERCIQLVKTYPEWRLSVQQHKQWGVR